VFGWIAADKGMHITAAFPLNLNSVMKSARDILWASPTDDILVMKSAPGSTGKKRRAVEKNRQCNTEVTFID
jgi:hypothetical protein